MLASHASTDSLADDVIRQYNNGWRGPVIIVGHSLGADAAVSMAARLNEARIPVALVVSFGPMTFPRVTANVAHIINYYQEGGIWHGKVSPGPGFRGKLVNINLANAPDVTHFNIEKVDRLQDDTIARILGIIGRRSTTAKAGQRPSDGASASSAHRRAD